VSAKNHADYAEQAEFCREMARRSDSSQRKAEWLRLANLWLSLAHLPAAGSAHRDPVLQAIINCSLDKGSE
jgi:hypothetical protein